MTFVPAVRNRSSSTPKSPTFGGLLRGLRPCCSGIELSSNGNTNGPFTIRIWIDGGRICRIVKEFENGVVY